MRREEPVRSSGVDRADFVGKVFGGVGGSELCIWAGRLSSQMFFEVWERV